MGFGQEVQLDPRVLAKVLRLTGPSQSRERIQTVWCENGSGRLLSGRELEDPSARGVLRAAFATIVSSLRPTPLNTW